MAQYLLLIYAEEAAWGRLAAEDRESIHQQFVDFNARNAGVIAGGAQLAPTATATAIRPNGEAGFIVSDGAFAETKEALGGYYLIDVPSLDEAIAVAQEIPVPFGCFELRPVLDFSD